jgi:hypothetical protein
VAPKAWAPATWLELAYPPLADAERLRDEGVVAVYAPRALPLRFLPPQAVLACTRWLSVLPFWAV